MQFILKGMGPVDILYSNILVMNQIHKYSLYSPAEEATIKVEQSIPLIDIRLLPHQILSLQKMRLIEESRNRGIWIGDEHLVCSYGILGDPSGTGKTATMLGHIGQMTEHPFGIHTLCTLNRDSLPSLYSVTQRLYEDAFNTLIVVPYFLLLHWQGEIQKTRLTLNTIKSQRDIDSTECIRRISQSHITLISNTLLHSLTARLKHTMPNYLWERVVYDEADMIRIPAACPFIRCKMSWLISARYKNLTHANQQIHSYILQKLSPDFLQSLEEPLQKLLTVYTQEHPHLVVYKTVSHSYFQSILRTTHPARSYFVVTTEEGFLQQSMQLPTVIRKHIVCSSKIPYIHAKTRSLMEEGKIEEAVLSICPRTMNRDAFLGSLLCPYKKERFLASSACTICFEGAEVPCISPCCTHLFCGSCMLRWLDTNAVCPICRADFPPSSLIKLQEQDPPFLDKMDTLLSLLREIQGQVIIASQKPRDVYDRIRLEVPHLAVDLLQGQLMNKKAAFERGEITVLVIPDDTVGVTFPSATHMIRMTSMGKEGRCQSIGRKEPLTILRLSSRQ
jgi:hypothetical protein